MTPRIGSQIISEIPYAELIDAARGLRGYRNRSLLGLTSIITAHFITVHTDGELSST